MGRRHRQRGTERETTTPSPQTRKHITHSQKRTREIEPGKKKKKSSKPGLANPTVGPLTHEKSKGKKHGGKEEKKKKTTQPAQKMSDSPVRKKRMPPRKRKQQRNRARGNKPHQRLTPQPPREKSRKKSGKKSTSTSRKKAPRRKRQKIPSLLTRQRISSRRQRSGKEEKETDNLPQRTERKKKFLLPRHQVRRGTILPSSQERHRKPRNDQEAKGMRGERAPVLRSSKNQNRETKQDSAVRLKKIPQPLLQLK